MPEGNARKRDAAGRTKIRLGVHNSAILAGDDDVSSWSDEELIRGQRKDKNNRWTGRPPRVLPRELYEELVRRRLSKADALLVGNLVRAVVLLGDVVQDKDAPLQLRMQASQLIIERVMGKPTSRVDARVVVEDPWAELLVGTISEVQEGQAVRPAFDMQRIIEGSAVTVVEEEEEPEPPGKRDRAVQAQRERQATETKLERRAPKVVAPAPAPPARRERTHTASGFPTREERAATRRRNRVGTDPQPPAYGAADRETPLSKSRSRSEF